MKYIAVGFLLFLSFSCSNKDVAEDLGWKCVYGKHTTTGQRQFIYCTIREIINVGTNQSAADKIAEQYGVPKVYVESSNNYTEKEFVASDKNCNCP